MGSQLSRRGVGGDWKVLYPPQTATYCQHRTMAASRHTHQVSQACAAPVTASADISGDDTNAAMYIKDMLGSNGIPKPHSGVILRGSLIPPKGHTHTTDKDSRRVVSVLGIRDGETVYAGRNLAEAERNARRLTVWPAHPLDQSQAPCGHPRLGCHGYIALLGNWPTYHTLPRC
jgi:hypothetical protein